MIRYYSIKIGIFRHSEREFIYHIFLFGQFYKIKKNQHVPRPDKNLPSQHSCCKVLKGNLSGYLPQQASFFTGIDLNTFSQPFSGNNL